MSKQKHIHFIGIAGSLIAPLAVAMRNMGYKVTGSDLAFYPPASTLLEQNKIKIIPGFNPDKFNKIGIPDIAMMMSFLTKKNPEVKYLIGKKVEIISLGQLLERYFIKKNSIVITGNFGKTTITSLLGWILEMNGMDPTVLAGGYMYNFGGGVKIGKSNWSVSEGDEFKNWHITRNYHFSRRPRILYQKPTQAVFTDATWDHYDQYKTETEYLNTFIKFIKQVPKEGFVIGNATGKNVRKVLSYSKAPTKLVELNLKNINYSREGSRFELNGEKYKTKMLGPIGAQNAALATSMALSIGIRPKVIRKALASYRGVKRRQQIHLKNKRVTIIDDFAHSPVKLRGLINALRLHYPKDKIILLYQPGNKDKEALSKYSAETFKDLDFLALPRVSAAEKKAQLFNQKLYSKLIKTELKSKLKYIEDDERMISFLIQKIEQYYKSGKHVIVLFAAQKGFRGMIEQLAEKLK